MMRIGTALISALVTGMSVSNVKAQERTAPPATLRPGDVVRIAVWRKPEFSGEFEISVDGSIKHPLYQEVRVAGLPLAEVSTRLREYLARYEANPLFTVEPLFRVAIGGEVRQPNLYSLPRETTIAQAIALAGGPSAEGRLDRVRLVREGSERYIDLTEPNAEWARVPVISGDQILVTRRRGSVLQYIAPIASILSVVVSIISLSNSN